MRSRIIRRAPRIHRESAPPQAVERLVTARGWVDLHRDIRSEFGRFGEVEPTDVSDLRRGNHWWEFWR